MTRGASLTWHRAGEACPQRAALCDTGGLTDSTELEKQVHKELTLCDSMHRKLNNRRTQSVAAAVRMVLTLMGGGWAQAGVAPRGLAGAMWAGSCDVHPWENQSGCSRGRMPSVASHTDV